MTNEEMLEVFGDFDPSQYEEEAKQRWGDTDAYRESARRTAGYRKADWEQIGREGEEINAAFIALMAAGSPRMPPRRAPWPSATAPTSRSGSTSARRRSTGAWARCTWPTPASPGTSTRPPRPGAVHVGGHRGQRRG